MPSSVEPQNYAKTRQRGCAKHNCAGTTNKNRSKMFGVSFISANFDPLPCKPWLVSHKAIAIRPKLAAMTYHQLLNAYLLATLGYYVAFTIVLAKANILPSGGCLPYRRARRMMVCAFVTISLQLAAACAATPFFLKRTNAVAADAAFFFGIVLFYRHAFLHLLDNSYSTTRRMLTDLVAWAITTVTAATAIFCHAHTPKKWAASLAAALLTAFMLDFALRFARLYKRVLYNLDNYYSDQMRGFIAWLRRSVLLLLVSGMLNIVMLYMSHEAKLVYMTWLTTVNTYIAISFANYARVYAKIQASAPDAPPVDHTNKKAPTEPAGTCETYTLGETQKKLLDAWIADGRYCQPGITIKTVARDIQTNRTYLSAYINENHHASFSEWVAMLRMQRAKELLAEGHTTLENIALHTGFSSASYFCRVFSSIEGLPPTQWKRLNNHTATATPKGTRHTTPPGSAS